MSDAALSTVRNAARLLKAFRTREESIGVSELARRLALGKSNVHRLLTTLVAEGLLEQDPHAGGYRLGIVMFELGEAVKVHLDLHAAAGPVLAQLREQTGESSQVGVLDGDEVVYVDRLESAYSLRLFTETGRRVPAHGTSSGKVLLAHLTEPAREAFLARPLPRLTPHTITDPDALRAELADRARPRAGPRPSTSGRSGWPASPHRSATCTAGWWPRSASARRSPASARCRAPPRAAPWWRRARRSAGGWAGRRRRGYAARTR